VAQCAGYDMGGLVKWLSWSGWSGIGRSRVAFCVGLDVCIWHFVWVWMFVYVGGRVSGKSSRLEQARKSGILCGV